MINLKGKFIVLDGSDGCGKTTQAKMLRDWAQSSGVQTAAFRDPGTTRSGEAIREILLGTDYGEIDPAAEVMLYMAARVQLWREQIAPALKAGKCVIMDRWLSSTCAYQGFAGGFGIENVVKIASLTLERLWPDLTILLDIDTDRSAARIERQLDRMELKGKDYHQDVAAGYKKLAEMANNRNNAGFGKFSQINADQTVKQVHKDIIKTIAAEFSP